MTLHAWDKKAMASPQHCRRCKLTREMAGAWWQYTRGSHFYGIISPAPPCDPAWPAALAPSATPTKETP